MATADEELPDGQWPMVEDAEDVPIGEAQPRSNHHYRYPATTSLSGQTPV